MRIWMPPLRQQGKAWQRSCRTVVKALKLYHMARFDGPRFIFNPYDPLNQVGLSPKNTNLTIQAALIV